MHAKISTKGNKFFAFNDTKDKEEWERAGGGESQTHYLFKMALLAYYYVIVFNLTREYWLLSLYISFITP